ncbi:LacI family DNA-binding transcriptional regulator [Paenibacillus sp. 79R4]|uniref:LacI family DNA-binding transcriptional regulator n=1 Tax=Paenibacillus sp. 79R4 TaxID=2212847 RepID=UPI002117DF27|nr:LacI family DNA-binding transcriptional regulator [Paenibacillus sp. 79R4]
MNPPTIKDVAKASGVSVATVSRVLHNLSGYSDKTKQKVLKAVEELGYQPNAIARGLINKRTQTIGVLVPDVSSSFSSEILHGIEQVANDKGFSVIMCNTDEDGKRTLKYLQVLGEKQVDGVIFTSGSLEDEYYKLLKQMRVPVVLVNTLSHKHAIPYVKVDDRQASYHATEYLIRKGHRDIAMICGTITDAIAGVPDSIDYGVVPLPPAGRLQMPLLAFPVWMVIVRRLKITVWNIWNREWATETSAWIWGVKR